MEHALAKGRRMAFLVDRIVLGDQMIDRLWEAGLPISVMQGSHPMFNPQQPIQIVSIQTLARRGPDQWPTVDVFCQDECHAQYEAVRRVMDKWSLIPWIGLTATPWTRGLGLTWDNLIQGPSVGDLIGMGYLSDYDAYGPDTPNLVGVRRSSGDYNTVDLEGRMNEISGSIVKHYLDRGRRDDGTMMKGLAFVPTVSYAAHVTDEFKQNGIDAEYVSYHDTDEQRSRKMEAYRNGDIEMMSCVDILTKGFDMGDIEYGVLARPTRSVSLHVQMMGRFLRTHPDKEIALIMDHAGNIARMGFPDSDYPTTLDMNEPGQNSDAPDPEEPGPWNCPRCTHLNPPRTPECSVCGHIRKRPVEVEVKKGILTRLENPNISEREQRQDVYSQLVDIAHHRNYSKGWVAHKYRAIFDVWPRRMEFSRKPASEELQGWVTSQNIRYAKRRTP
jgi:superfamily II DNA or RNA helicase